MSTKDTFRAGTPTLAPDQHRVRREDWLTDGLVSGFLATFIMTVVLVAAYGVARVIGSTGEGGLAQWFAALSNNLVTDRTGDQVALALAVNLAIGLILAVIYAYFVEPALSGPGWKRGMQFALIPWALSILVFLPLIGAGFLGLGLGAGFLPVLGNLILHLVYGAVLGGYYAIAMDQGIESSEIEHRNAVKAERGAAIGVVVGLVLGLLAGWALGPQLAGDLGNGAVLIAGGLIGAAGGLAAGSFLGMGAVRNAS
jgi:hypothetical protein